MLLGRVYRIFLRYAEMNVALDRSGPLLRSETGSEIGRLEAVMLRRNRLVLEGWVDARRVGVEAGGHRQWVVPDLLREGHQRRGFTLDIPFFPGPFALLAERGEGVTLNFPLPGISKGRLRAERMRLVVRFATTLAALAPEIWRWKRRGDLGAREIVKERLSLVPRSDAAVMNAALFPDSLPIQQPEHSATLILPVYNAFSLLPEVLARLANHSGSAWRLLVIDDASSDPGVLPFLRDWCAGRDRVELLENEVNLGFIGTVNRGLAMARARWPEDPVVLVNADALVPSGWLPRLLAPLSEPDVASVTPMSNDAEIFNVPAICQRTDLALGDVDAIDLAASQLDPRAGLAEAPTGVGFCMALAPAFLAKIPQFDSAFGQGYGEENDWCCKASALGGRHLCTPNLFVEHRGGQSFGNAQKQRLLERNLRIISSRYPNYDSEVQQFIRRDPLTTPRLALGLALAARRQRGPVPLYIAHSMGGGAEHWLCTRIAEELAEGRASVVLRVGQGHRWKLELHAPEGKTEGLTNDFSLVQRMLEFLPRRRVIYSCGVGERDAIALPGRLMELAGAGTDGVLKHPVEVLIHDYFPISPSYTLLSSDGTWRGVPVAGAQLETDPAHNYERPGGERVPLTRWQAEWGRLLTAAERVVVFSESSRGILIEAYPKLTQNVVVRPHMLHEMPPRLAQGKKNEGGVNELVIGVLGNIGFHKGAALLQRLSRELARNGLGRLVVLGQVDPDYRLAPPSQVHGSYEMRDLPGLVARYGISHWLMPSIWPETFSFTTHEMLATGLPITSFDLGAQGEAVRRAVAEGAPGRVVKLDETDPLQSLKAALWTEYKRVA